MELRELESLTPSMPLGRFLVLKNAEKPYEWAISFDF
jgi:hypothetical protein